MSMVARFVAVAPKRLDEVRNSSEQVEALFVARLSPGRSRARQALHERIRSQSPRMLKASLEQAPPEMRAQVLRGLGISEADFDGADGGELFVTRMIDRVAKLLGESGEAGEPAGKSISLEKAWHGLHYLLCESAEPLPGPLGQAVFGGTEIGDDMGYGPARCFTPAEVSDIAQGLQAPGLESTLRSRFDAGAMEKLGIYPGGVWDEGPDWLIDAFRELRDFYAGASAAGQAVVTVIE